MHIAASPDQNTARICVRRGAQWWSQLAMTFEWVSFRKLFEHQQSGHVAHGVLNITMVRCVELAD